VQVHVSAALLPLIACSYVSISVATHADATDRLTKTVAAGRPIRVDATIADLAIVGSARDDVAVEIVRHAPTAEDLAKYPAVVDDTSTPLRISAVQADEGRDPNLKSEITIAAPAGAVFEAVRVFEGKVKLTNLSGACDLDLRRGGIEAIGIGGRMRLEAGIGSLDVRQAELTPGGMMRLRVFNGPLRVRLARMPANARILAVTFNGTIASDIPLTMKDKFGPRFGETTIGTGEPVMSIDVVKGDITIGAGGK
jgi:hypothetical protein